MNNLSAVEPLVIAPPVPTLVAAGGGVDQVPWTHPLHLSRSGAPHRYAARPHKTAKDHADDCKRVMERRL